MRRFCGRSRVRGDGQNAFRFATSSWALFEALPEPDAPGMTANMMDDKDLLSKFAERIPLGRLCEPREVACHSACKIWELIDTSIGQT